MSQVLGMLRNGVITPEEYQQMNDRMKEKYHPVSDGLIFETDLIFSKGRSNMAAEKDFDCHQPPGQRVGLIPAVGEYQDLIPVHTDSPLSMMANYTE